MKAIGWDAGPVSHLDHQIINTSHPMRRAVLRAERAGLLARMGQGPAALAEISSLRTEFKAFLYPELSVRLYLAEAWQGYFTDFSPAAGAFVRRAHALSQAAGLRAEKALSAAWLAHMNYTELDFHAMVKHVLEALQGAEPLAHHTHSRACLVLADAYHLAGAFQCAQPWYGQARWHAMAARDRLTLSAINHNMAWHRTLQALQQSVWGGPDVAKNEARQALASMAATQALDMLTGSPSPAQSLQWAQALSYSVLGQYDQALNRYGFPLERPDTEGLLPLKPLVLADMAWCFYQIGKPESAQLYAAQSFHSLGSTHHPDTLALAHARLSQVFDQLAEPVQALKHRQDAELTLHTHRQLQGQVLLALHPVSESGRHFLQATYSSSHEENLILSS